MKILRNLTPIVALCLALGGNVALAASAAANPNILVFFIDDQGLDGTPIQMIPGKDFSHKTTYKMPNLERIASKGIIFSDAYASHPKCEGSRAAYQMGRSTITLNAIDKWHVKWNAPVTDSLANTLKRANPAYRAAHFGKWQWPQTPESMGYDAHDGITMNEDGNTTDPNDPKQTFSMTRKAQAYMQKQVREGHPFYLQLSYYAVHSTPQALASTLAKYSGPDALQRAMTEDLDANFGVLLQELEKLGIADKTYIIYMSDNGMTTTALKGTKALLDEAGIRVPLIVSGPGITAKAYSSAPAVGYDIYATVLDLAAPGFALPKGVEGGSWKPVLLNGGKGTISRPINRIVWHHDVEVPHPQTAIRQGDYKLLHYWDTKQSFLYNLTKDVQETTNLAAQEPARVASMLADIKNHIRPALGEAKLAELESGKGGDVPGGGMAAGGMAAAGMEAGGMAAGAAH